MTPFQISMGVYSALYTLCCFAAGLVVGNGIAWRFAIAAFGIEFLAHLAVVRGSDGARWISLGGVGCGVISGLSLLF